MRGNLHQRLVFTWFATLSDAKTSNIPHQLHGNYIGISFQFITSRDHCDLWLLTHVKVSVRCLSKAWFPFVLRFVRIGDYYDIPTSGILTTSGNTSSQKSQTVGDFYDVIGRIGIISTLKVLSQTSQTSEIFTTSVNLAVLRIAIVVRIPISGNRKNPPILTILRTSGNQA